MLRLCSLVPWAPVSFLGSLVLFLAFLSAHSLLLVFVILPLRSGRVTRLAARRAVSQCRLLCELLEACRRVRSSLLPGRVLRVPWSCSLGSLVRAMLSNAKHCRPMSMNVKHGLH
eukprot:9497962-Pyramimonas_sp.AAC.1